MTWHPAFTGADPASGWFTPAQLEQLAREEREAIELRHMLRRRALFESMVARVTAPLSTDDMRSMWDQASTEARKEG